LLVALAVGLATIGIYIGAYLLRGKPTTCMHDDMRLRTFSNYREVRLFWPAMYAEGVLTGLIIAAEYPRAEETMIDNVYDPTDS